MTDEDDGERTRLDRTQRSELRRLGWRWLTRRRAKRPRQVRRRERIDVTVEDEETLVDLDAVV